MSTKWFRSGLVATLLSFALVSVAAAQSVSSNTRGTVTNEAGTPISNATVVITHAPSGTRATATTGPSGGYFKSGLRVGGPYTVAVSADGYRSSQLQNIYLRPGSQPAVTIALEAVSAEIEEIVVTAQATEIYDLANGVGSAFSARDIGNTPTTTRDVIRTLLRDPLAQSNGTGNLSVAGVNPRFNGLSIDGSLQQDDFGLGSNTYATERSPINLDAVESASLVASDYSVTASGFTGGLVNLTTKSGTNEWDGSVFYFSQTDSNIGDKYDGDNIYNAPPLDEIEQGITLGGPIIKDKLFFFVSYDEFESANSADFFDDDQDDGIESGFFPALAALIEDRTGYNPGGRPDTASVPVTSERRLAKLDWNISDRHRASYTYQKTEETGSNVDSLSFETAWYDVPATLEANTFQFYSDWSSSLSTTLRVNKKEWQRLQRCRAGTGVGAVEIEDLDPADLAGTSLDGLLTGDELTFVGGCDRFRHANDYFDDRLQVLAKADYFMGDHVISAGLEYEDFSLFNVFLSEGARGWFLYDGYDGLNTSTAEVSYQNVPEFISDEPAAVWGLEKWSLFLQDSVQVSSDLEISYGLRYETYEQSDKPRFSQEVFDTYGVRSDVNLDGRDLILPRVSFRWDLNDRTTLTGGFGKFSGGEPKVWISNAFSKQSVIRAEEIVGADPTVIPQSLIDAVNAATVALPLDVIDPNFTIPSDWKASLKLERLMDLGFLGDGYTFTAQALYTKASNGFRWINLAQTDLPGVRNTGVAPDGRVIYADLDDLGIDNLMQLTNHSDGSSTALSVGLTNEFDNGFDFRLAYAFQDIEVVTEGFSSRGISNWRGTRGLDRNNPSATISPYQVEHSIKLGLGYEKDFFGTGQSATRIDFFAQRVSGDHYNWTFNIDSDNSLFGRAGQRQSPYDNNPLYVPTGPSDPLVVYGEALNRDTNQVEPFDQAGFFSYIEGNGIGKGAPTTVNGYRAGWNTLSSLRIQQEIPGLPFFGNSLGDNNFKIVLDIDNVLNLINSDWGRFVNGPGRGDNPIVTADLVSAADVAANGALGATALEGDSPRTTCTSQSACLYRFNAFNDRGINSISRPASVYSIRLGIRFDF